jgi:hypothetical protein
VTGNKSTNVPTSVDAAQLSAGVIGAKLIDVHGDSVTREAADDAAGNGHEYLPCAGQSAGLVAVVLLVAEIVRRTISQAEEALKRVESYRVATDA